MAYIGSNQNSNFGIWAFFLVLASIAFPVIGFYLMYKEAGKENLDLKSKDLIAKHYMWSKVALGTGIVAGLGLAVGSYNMYNVLHA